MKKGEQVWPKAQDDASFVLVDASCSAEAVARISPQAPLSIRDGWCGEAWQVDAHLKRLQR
ncbi:hypothetical protein ACLK2H_01935 [Escherichia coli]